jgi:prepilin signal peptidase PulO-like enzyme (type II secretory pathway)
MIYALFGLMFGMTIPYLARRFAKFMPATAGYALYRIVWPTKRVSAKKRKENPRYRKLTEKYLMRSIGWGIVSAALSYALLCVFGERLVGWYLAFVWILLLLYEIDERLLLLPDLLTVPLLICGFAFAAFVAPMTGQNAAMYVRMSALGAAAGYVLPVIASLFMIRRHPEAFGGGDIKLLSACGAWLGLEAVPYLILGASAVFGITMGIKRCRVGAFGPSIVIAAIALAFLLN